MEADLNSLIVVTLILVSGIISLELGVSVAVFEIIGGIFVFNMMGINIADLDWINFFANLGLIGILFYAGFETDIQLIKTYWRRSILIGLFSYLIPFVLVMVASILIFKLSISQGLLVSIALSTTSIALVFSLLKQKNILQKKTSQVLLSGAMVVDIISMISLAVFFEGFHWYTLIIFILVLLLLLFFPKIIRFVFERYSLNDIELRFRAIMMVMLTLSLLSVVAEVHVAILAFVCGIAFAKVMKQYNDIKGKLKAIIFGFMAPVFFFRSGMYIDLSIFNLQILIYIIVFGILSIVGKFLASYIIINKLLGKKYYFYAGGLFNMRLTFGIICGLFGLQAGIINKEIYTSIMIVILISCILAAVIFRNNEEELE